MLGVSDRNMIDVEVKGKKSSVLVVQEVYLFQQEHI
jgi:hypothetical protein